MKSGERIKSLRNEKGLTQKELSKLSCVSEISIRKYENGDRNPKQDALYKIAKALDVNEAWLMGYDVSMERNEDLLSKQSQEFSAFIKYLESIGYIVRLDQDEEMETYEMTITKEKASVTFTEEAFESFRSAIEKAVDFELFKAIKK